MNREQAAKLLPIIQAWVEGKEIQVKFLDQWTDILNKSTEPINWGMEGWEYRIKPEVQEGWINIVHLGPRSDNNFDTAVIWDSENKAKRSAAGDCRVVATIKITYTEGEGL